MKVKSKKLFTVLLSFIMVVTMIPQSAFATNEGRNIWRANEIPNGSTLKLQFKSGTGYIGLDKNNCLEFEMLDNSKTNTGSTTGVFAISKEIITISNFNNSWGDNVYQGSELQRAMKTVYENMEEPAKVAVMETSKTDAEYGEFAGVSSLVDDYVFPLSEEEANTYYKSNEERKASGGEYNSWWLRSPAAENNQARGVHGEGGFYSYVVWYYTGVRIALNLTASSLFSSSGDGVYTLIDARNKVEFQDDNGKVIKVDMVKTGDDATAPTDTEMQKKGYTFKGWDRIFTNVTSDMVVKPIYTPIEYSVTLNDTNGAPARTKTDIAYIAGVVLTQVLRPGYTFAGWNTKEDGTGEQYEAIAYNMSDLAELADENKEVKLYAQWTENTNYMVEYKTNTKEGMENAPKVDSIRDIAWTEEGLIPEGVAVEGYTLDGWYADKGLTNKVDETTTYGDIAKTEKGKVTLYAKWLKNYNVKVYNIEGQETPIFDGYVPEGVFTETVQHGDNKGYGFAGWYTLNAEGEEEFTIGESQITGDTEVYGKWTPVYYTVNFYSNRGETETYKTVEALKDWELSKAEIPANPEDPTGEKAFECWETADGRAFDLNTEPITEDNLNLYGKWVGREDINDVAEITWNQNVEYTGNPITLRELGIKVTLEDGGKVLTKGIDFEVEYEPVEIGDGSFTLKGKGYYKGVTAPKEFTVKDPVVNNVTGLKVASTTGTQIDLKWTAANVTTKPIAGYNIYDSNKKLVAKGLKVTKATFSKLSAGKAYTYTVKAYVTVGNRDIESKGVSVTGITVPAKVVISKVTTKSKTVTATWKKAICTKYS